MSLTERTEIGLKSIDIHNLITSKVFKIGSIHGFPTYKLEMDVESEKEKKDGTKLVRVEPFVLGTIKQEDLKAGSGNFFLMHNPHDKNEESSYLISTGSRDWGDGETTRQIVISKIDSPHKFQNKKDWVKKNVDAAASPWTSQSEFQSQQPQFPTILITLYDQSITINYKGQLDRLSGEIYSFFRNIEDK